jgi:hypothetical protein
VLQRGRSVAAGFTLRSQRADATAKIDRTAQFSCNDADFARREHGCVRWTN